ncbi:hypothetical protein EV193_112140 [Herbihabitans rhizosphaerae]|uniref:PH (Pleckstrin Homology) domain-containing protein n=1 Tax=Herbihabitans rhizosphaerae TaxID=1872711 RepID=A0A4Q7KG28_9PSEU|nr:hypothetical protein [Herbihabitans rhizosphaerae]RZS32506.1 hypothetical protein EV193_112140 [Herbihabitans rhizosphaerae]
MSHKETSFVLDGATRRWAWAGVFLFLPGGAALTAAGVLGLTGGEPGRRPAAIGMGLVLLALGGGAAWALSRGENRLVLDRQGLTVPQVPDVEFTVGWSELREVRVYRERRGGGETRMWHYDLVLAPRLGDFAERHPEMADWHSLDGYRYSLGALGLAGRRLDRAFTRFAGGSWTGMRTVDT